MITRRSLLWCALLLTLVMALPARTQDYLIGPDSYPPGVNPLTGQAVADPFVLDRRPLIIKVSNFPEVVRPQSGLMRADIVWEHVINGGATGFSAVYYGRDIDTVGPIRSLWLLDFELVRIYRALSAYSGISQGTTDRLRADGVMSTRIVGGVEPCPAFCRIDREGLTAEQSIFGNTEALRELADDRGRDVAAEAVSGMAFTDEPLQAGRAITSIRVQYSETTVEWGYNPDSGRWERSQDGQPHLDYEGGRRIVASNVVVIEAPHDLQAAGARNYWGQGDFAYTVDLIGSGQITLFRDGQYFTGEWRRAGEDDPLTFFDAEGALLTFRPGNTFFNLVPRWVDGYALVFVTPDAPTVRISSSRRQFLRTGPGEDYRSPDLAESGAEFALIGRNNNGTWLQVLRADGQAFWLPANVLDADAAAIAALPRTRPTLER